MLYKYGKRMRNFPRVCFLRSSLVSNILGAFSIKEYFHPRLLLRGSLANYHDKSNPQSWNNLRLLETGSLDNAVDEFSLA